MPGVAGAHLRGTGRDPNPRLEHPDGVATDQRSGHRKDALAERETFYFVAGAGGRAQTKWQTQRQFKARRNRAGRMFCMAARPLAKSVDKALGGGYRRLRGRTGGLAANVALALLF